MDKRAKVISLSMDMININKWKKKIEQKMNYPFLDSNIDRPEIDEEKLRVLTLIFHGDSEPRNERVEKYIIATMLVQTALDTHEHVSVQYDPVKDPKDKVLSDQLSVLAGDYYSGLYYYLLAEIQEFDFIHQLATAIKEINEQKMKLYYINEDSLDAYVNTIQEIESLLYVYAAKAAHSTELIPIIKKWLLLNRLWKENENIINNEISIAERLLQVHSELNKQEYVESLYFILEQTKAQLESDLTHLPAEYSGFKKYIQETIEQVYASSRVAEEG